MQIVLIVAVVATLIFAESAPSSPIAGPLGMRLALVVGAMACVPLFALGIQTLVLHRLRHDVADVHRIWRFYRRLRIVHLILWLTAIGVVAYGLQWPRIVQTNWHLSQIPLVDDLLILLPVLLPLVLSWAVFYRVDRTMLGGRGQMASLREYLDLHLRHYLAIAMVPILSMLAIQDLIGLLFPKLLRSDSMVIVLVLTMLLLLALFPLLLRCVWRTSPLPPGSLRKRLEAMARDHGLKVRDILVWQTGSMVANAAVAGFTRRFRYVFLTDGLIDLLDEEQIVAVFSHELAHIRHRHLWLRAAAMLIPLSAGLFVFYTFPEVIRSLERAVATVGLDIGGPLGLPALLLLVLYVLTFFGSYSRCLEHEADLSACRAMPPEIGVSALCSALEQLAAAGGNRGARGWQHASVARRVDFLKSTEREPKIGLTFYRRVRLYGGIVVVLSLSPLIGLLLFSYLLG